MKRLLLLSLFALIHIAPIKCDFWSIFQGRSGKITYSTPEEVYRAFIHLAGSSISNRDKDRLWTEAQRCHTQIQTNMRDLGDAYSSQLIAQTILDFFLLHIKTLVENEAYANGLPRHIAHTFYAEQTRRIGLLSPKHEVSSPYDLPYGVFAPLFGNNLEAKMAKIAHEYHAKNRRQQETINWVDVLIGAGIIIGEIIDYMASTSPTPPPAPAQRPTPSAPPAERHVHHNPCYEPPVARPVPVGGEKTGLNKIYENTMDADCMGCGEPFSKSCQRAFFPCGHAPYCVKCLEKANYACPFRDTLKPEDLKRLKERLYFPNCCVTCYKNDGTLQTLPRCGHKMCGVCAGLWRSLKADLSEFCPRCAVPLA